MDTISMLNIGWQQVGPSENHTFLRQKSQKNHKFFVIFYTFKTNILTLGYTDFCGHCYDLSRDIHAQNTPHTLAQWTLEYPNISPPLHQKNNNRLHRYRHTNLLTR